VVPVGDFFDICTPLYILLVAKFMYIEAHSFPRRSRWQNKKNKKIKFILNESS
jgi:hypothetical protein